MSTNSCKENKKELKNYVRMHTEVRAAAVVGDLGIGLSYYVQAPGLNPKFWKNKREYAEENKHYS